MSCYKLIYSFLLSFLLCNANAQSAASYNISEATDLAGNIHANAHALCMKNGNTMLFYVEKDKKMIIKIFDSAHKEIVSTKYDSWIFNTGISPNMFEGAYDMNDEGVVFLVKEVSGKNTLVRLRVNSHTGAIIEDKKLIASKYSAREIYFYIIKHKEEENYEVLSCMNDNHTQESEIAITFYNNRHETLKEMQLPVDRKKYDNLQIVGARSHINGVLITVALTQRLVFATGSNATLNARSSTDDHFLQFFYIPMDTKNATSSIVHLSTGVFPSYSHYEYNPFAQSLNLLLYSYKAMQYKFGQNIQEGDVSRNIFFKLDEHNVASAGFNELQNKYVNDILKKEVDTARYFNGRPLRMFTDDNGLTTIISTSRNREVVQDEANRSSIETYIQDIGITQVDDDGNELWGTLLPVSQYYNYTRSFPKYSSQMTGLVPVNYNKNFYVVYNDYDNNFNNTIAKRGDTVFNFNATNACYYKVDKKKNITKNHLFGTPKADENITAFTGSASFDYQRGIYATLVQYKKGADISLRMAWSHLE